MRQMGDVGHADQDTERAGTEMQNKQVMQWWWSLENPVPGSPTTVRLKTPEQGSHFSVYPGLFQPCYIVP